MLHSILKHLVPINKSIANNIMCLISNNTRMWQNHKQNKNTAASVIFILNNSSLQRENWVTYIFILNLLCFE